MKQFDTID
jgi:hypothetical protein